MISAAPSPTIGSSTSSAGAAWASSTARVDTRLGREVALKFLPDQVAGNEAALARFRREARAASALNHPNICTLYDVGEHEGRHFIAMELLRGQAVADRLRPVVRCRSSEVRRFGAQLAGALEVSHAQGIVHRDVKPRNVFITERGDAKILDFGLAKATPQLESSASGLTLEADLTPSGAWSELPATCRPSRRSAVRSAGAAICSRWGRSSTSWRPGVVRSRRSRCRRSSTPCSIAIRRRCRRSTRPLRPSSIASSGAAWPRIPKRATATRASCVRTSSGSFRPRRRGAGGGRGHWGGPDAGRSWPARSPRRWRWRRSWSPPWSPGARVRSHRRPRRATAGRSRP